MAYADYAFYKNTYLGNAIEEADFPTLAERASEYVDYITRGKATDTEPVKRAMCALAEAYQTIEKARANAIAAGGEIQSQTVGSYSVSYRSATESFEGYEATLHRTAQRYLANTGLLYRGGRCYACTPLTR